ncbi:autotransporter domain-containing protein [Atlantibacter hermannii]
MMTTIGSGCRTLSSVAIFACCICSQGAFAWQQEYSVDDPESNTFERYTWDSDHQPDYNDILAERLNAPLDMAYSSGFNLITSSQNSATTQPSTLGVGLAIPVYKNVTTGPVASWHWDGSTASMFNDYGDSMGRSGGADQLWHASVSTLGWRVDSTFGYVRPWAQVSYNQQYGENVWKSQSGMHAVTAANQYGNWMDVTVGADMPLNKNLAAYASFSQSEGIMAGDMTSYNLGVNARF